MAVENVDHWKTYSGLDEVLVSDPKKIMCLTVATRRFSPMSELTSMLRDGRLAGCNLAANGGSTTCKRPLQ